MSGIYSAPYLSLHYEFLMACFVHGNVVQGRQQLECMVRTNQTARLESYRRLQSTIEHIVRKGVGGTKFVIDKLTL
jgi:hypothetical protein